MNCEPATSIIEKFGGPEAVSIIVGTTPGQVRRWRRDKARGGTGGAVPHWHIPKLIAAAHERRIRARAEDFLPKPEHEHVGAA